MALPKKAAEKTEVATTNSNSALPAYLADTKKGTHLQGMDASDYIVPRIKLLQGISDELTTFENAKDGIFWLNVLDIPLGETLDFIPISNRKRYLLLPPRGDTRGVLARADDGKTWNPPTGEWEVKLKNIKNPVKWVIPAEVSQVVDGVEKMVAIHGDVRKSGLAEFGSSNPDDPDSNPAATLFYEYLVYLPDFPEYSPALLSLARSQAKKARDLNGKIEFSGQPMQALKLTAKVVVETKDGDKFNNYLFIRNGFAEEEQFDKCVGLNERYGNYRGADEEGLAEDGGAPTGPVERGEV